MRKCNFCNSDDFKILYNNTWNIVKCSNCGFVFTNPVPDNLEDFYTEDYFKDKRHKKNFYSDNGDLILNVDYTNRIRLIENFVEKRGEILEIGAARGTFLKQLKEYGWGVNGVELSKDAVDKAKELYDLNLFCGDFLDYKIPHKFNVICMFQTLEHIEKPKDIIKKTYSSLNEKGLFVIEVPNFNSWDIKWDKQQKELVYDLPRHLNHFTPLFLKKQLEKEGFNVIYIDRYYPKFILNLFIKKKKRKENNLSDGKQEKNQNNLPLLRLNNSWKIKLLNKISIIFPGWRFTIVARKK